jgi:predicted nucleic acid-binding protein
VNLVVDASVALKWFFTDQTAEGHIEEALTILDALDAGWVRLVQPPHFLAEMAAVLVREKNDAAFADLEDLQQLDWQILNTPEVYQEAMLLSRDRNHHLFDTLYHAVARCLPEAILVTADRRYHHKAADLGGISLLENLNLTNRLSNPRQ